jgi:hypothetical protein
MRGERRSPRLAALALEPRPSHGSRHSALEGLQPQRPVPYQPRRIAAALTRAHTLTGIKSMAIRRPRNGGRLHCLVPAGRHRLKGVKKRPIVAGERKLAGPATTGASHGTSSLHKKPTRDAVGPWIGHAGLTTRTYSFPVACADRLTCRLAGTPELWIHGSSSSASTALTAGRIRCGAPRRR